MEVLPQSVYVADRPCLGLSSKYIAYIQAKNFNFHEASFRTLSSFHRYCNRFGLHLVRKHTIFDTSRAAHFYLKETIENQYFYKKDELPAGVRRFKAICNGNIVWCYWKREGDVILIFRPNPNAKKIYKPCSLEKLIAFQNRNGIF